MLGYYDPNTPKHCELSREEFPKVFAGTLAALCGVWSAYIGDQVVRAILTTVLSDMVKRLDEEHPLPLERYGSPCAPKWSLKELHWACCRSLYGFCTSWVVTLGRQQLLDELRLAVQDDGGWGHNATIAEFQRDFMLSMDEKEAAEKSKREPLQ